MILQSLCDLYGRLKDDPDYRIAPPGYSPQQISFKIVIRPNGDLFTIEDARVREGRRLRAQQRLVPGPTKPSGSGLNPCFLWDTTAYMLGFKPDDPNPTRTVAAFTAFQARHLSLESDINASPFSAVCAFLSQWNPQRAQSHEVLRDIPSGFGVFQLLGETSLVHDHPDIRSWWDEHRQDKGRRSRAQCLITGEFAPIERTHPKIKGVMGAQSAGATIVSYNEDAYESYGKTQNLNAPVSAAAAFEYTTALNALLNGPCRTKHRVTLGDTTLVFWTARPTVTEDVFACFFSEGTLPDSSQIQDDALREKLHSFITALKRGQPAYTDAHRTAFYILGLSPNAGRLSVRYFYQGSVKQILDNLRRHYEDIGILPEPARGKRKADPEFPPTWLLLAQAGRESKDIPPVLAGPLLRAVLTGARYPAGLFSAVMRRIRADREISYPRVCVVKGYLTRNLRKDVSMSLDTDRTDPGYRLGRLFAALEKTQADALGNVNASIRDRYYSSASATPRVVFPRILRTYQHHLGKLEGGRKVNRERLIQEILEPLPGFPAHLNLEDQGLFAIGYYHQTRDFYTKKDA